MPPNVVSLVRAGRFLDAFNKLEGASNDPASPLTRQLVRAELLQFLGHNAEARGVATSLLRIKRLPFDHAVRVREVLGLAAQDEGHPTEATAHFATALNMCREQDLPRDLARVLLRLLLRRTEASPVGTREHLVTEVTSLVVSVGDPHLHATLHLRLGQLRAKSGEVEKALQHFDRGRTFLNTDFSVYLSGLLALDTSVAHSVRGDFDSAISWATRAREEANISGHARTQVACLANLSDYLVRRGDLQQALAWLNEGLTAAERFPAIRTAIIDSQARLLLQEGRASEAVALLRSLPIIDLERIERSNVWLHLSLLDTQADALSAMGQTNQALSLLSEAEAALGSGVADAFGTEITIKRAQLLIETGDYRSAAQEVIAGLTRLPALEARQLTELRHLAAALASPESRAQGASWPVEVLRQLGASRPSSDVGQALLQYCREMSGPSAELVTNPLPVPATSHLSESDSTTIDLGCCQTHRYQLRVARPTTVHEALVLRSLWELASLHARSSPRSPLCGEPHSDGHSSAMRLVWDFVGRFAPTDATILLTGETGVGKEFVARRVHQYSRRSTGPFVPFNCAAVPPDMLESQLFGHRKGAFTGAVDAFPGVIRAADGGTLLLDEFGEIGLTIQPKFLRFLDTGEVHPLGEGHPIRANSRVLIATNADLQTLMATRTFREDLFYRISALSIRIPPLRERREDLPGLARGFLAQFGQVTEKQPPFLSEEALDAILVYDWPGNVRQLQSEMRRLVLVLDAGQKVKRGDLSPAIVGARTGPGQGETDTGTLQDAVDRLERALVTRALVQHQTLDEAAESLGLSRKGLFLKRRRLGLL